MALPVQIDTHTTMPATPRAKRLPQGSRKPVSLSYLRRDLGLTQTELADATGMSQGDLSRLERRADHLLSTLIRYVEAMGGRLEVAAIFGSRRYPLEIEQADSEAPPPATVESTSNP